MSNDMYLVLKKENRILGLLEILYVRIFRDEATLLRGETEKRNMAPPAPFLDEGQLANVAADERVHGHHVLLVKEPLAPLPGRIEANKLVPLDLYHVKVLLEKLTREHHPGLRNLKCLTDEDTKPEGGTFDGDLVCSGVHSAVLAGLERPREHRNLVRPRDCAFTLLHGRARGGNSSTQTWGHGSSNTRRSPRGQ